MEFFKPVQNPWQLDIQYSVKSMIDQFGLDHLWGYCYDVDWWSDQVPALLTFLDSIECHAPKLVMPMIVNAGSKSHMHVDSDPVSGYSRSFGINIPIQNTHNTAMVWYDHVTFTKCQDLTLEYPNLPKTYGQGVPLFSGGTQLCELELLDTYLVRTDCPHRIIHNGSDLRLILSITTTESHLKLWPEFEPTITYSSAHFLTLPPETECVFFPGGPNDCIKGNRH